MRRAAAALIVGLLAGCATAHSASPTRVSTAAVTVASTTADTTDSSSASTAPGTSVAPVVTTTVKPTHSTAPPAPPAAPAPATGGGLTPGLLADVAAASHLGPVPAGTPIGAAAAGDAPVLYSDGCHVVWSGTAPKDGCVFGDPHGSVTIVVTGDSHAAAFFGAFDEAGKANHWRLVMVTKMGCPTADVRVYSAQNPSKSVPYTACDQWRVNALHYIQSLHADLVVFPLLSTRTVIGKKGAAGLQAWQGGLGRSIDAVRSGGTRVLVIGDTPRTIGQQIPACVAAHKANVAACGNPRSAAVDPARMAAMAQTAAAHGASFVDPSNWSCTATFCPAVIGTSVVYRDDHHLTDRFSRTRWPEVAAAVQAALAARP